MTSVHPTFDPLTATWFIDQFEAPSLSQLLNLLPRRTKFKDYFPNGYIAARAMSTQQRVYLPVKSSFHFQAAKPKSQPKPAPIPLASDDAILDDWKAGMSGDAIADKYGILNQRSVMKKIKKARDHGDPRAVPHQKSFASRPKRYNHEKILELWVKGLTGPEIGRQLGLHASTTAAAIVAEYRHKGDPRASPRAPSARQPGQPLTPDDVRARRQYD